MKDKNKIKIIKSILFSTIGVLPISVGTTIALSSCGKKQIIGVTGVKLYKNAIWLYVGNTSKLTATVLPENATNKKVTWSSSNESIATVDKNGNITAVSEGTADITVTTEEGGFTDICKVTVNKDVIPVESISLDAKRLDLFEGDRIALVANILPTNATNKNVTWSSLKHSIATVDQNGIVTAISRGDAEISATTEDGWHTATCKVTVIKKPVQVDSVKLNINRLFLEIGDSYKLTAIVLPEDATNKNVTWSSSKPAIATVNQNGNVTAISKGDVDITVTTKDGNKTATCKVTVTEKIIPVEGIVLDKDELKLNENATAKLTATVLPTNATNKNVTWSSLNSSIATVDQNGLVTAISPGTVDIIVKTEDGLHSATCQVVVDPNVPVQGVIINERSLDLPFAWNHQLNATVLPWNATNRKVYWSSSNKSVATVDQDGNVTAISVGKATITVTTEDGGFTDSCELSVKEYIPAHGVSISEHSLSLPFAWEHQFIANVLPWNANNRSVTWSSSNESVVTIDPLLGIAKAVGLGKATITVTTWDGLHKDTCEVKVKEYIPVESVELTEHSLSLPFAWEHQFIANVLPWNANNRGVSWSSSNESVLTIDPLLGIAKAVGLGKATITVTTWDGLHKDTCEVTVTP